MCKSLIPHFSLNPFPGIGFVLDSRDSPCSIVMANAHLIQTVVQSITGPTQAKCMHVRYIQDEVNMVFQSEISLFLTKIIISS